MVQLGQKIQKAFSSLGKKTNKITTNIGNKTNNVLKEAKGVANVLEKKANQVYNTAENAVNKIPNLNEQAIKLGNNVIQKSGGLTDVLRKSSVVGNKIIAGVNDLGGKNIPVLGTALGVAEKASGQLARGAKKLDKIRDNAQQKLDKYSEVSRGTISDIEKMNRRKREELTNAAEDGMANFA